MGDDRDLTPRLMQIGEIAERAGMSLRTLRHYDEIGLLTPSARSEGGFRLYTSGDLDRLLIIRWMKPLGYGLEAMHAVMELLRTAGPDAPEWEPVIAEARERRAQLARQLAMADEFIALLEGAGNRGAAQPPSAGRSSAAT